MNPNDRMVASGFPIGIACIALRATLAGILLFSVSVRATTPRAWSA
jgi:hypothetical protein